MEEKSHYEGHHKDIEATASFNDATRVGPNTEEGGATSNETEKEIATVAAVHDTVSADVIDWDGEDDPLKPMNWTNIRKFKNIIVICYCTFLT
jgi:hypothetical protein